MDDTNKKIADTIASQPIVAFVKGSREMPMCGFSKGVMDILDMAGAKYKTVDVLSDPDIREGIKRFTHWPTIPQIFFKGEFVGGFDILRDLHEKGQLAAMVKEAMGK
jgi:monothiol glutaredoxin